MNMPRRSGGDGGGGGEEEVEEDVKSSSGSLPPRLQSSTPKGALSLCAPSSSSSPTSSSSSSCSSFSPTSFSSSSFSSSSSSSLPSLEALQVVHFVAVQEDQDILVDPPPPSQTFSPLFSHHFFKENECIVGYDELSIIIYFAPDTFDAYVKIEGSVSKKAKDPSAIHAELKRNLFESIPYPGGFSSSIDDFLTTVRQHRKLFKPPGRVVSEKHLIREHRGSRKIDKMKKEEEKEDEKKKEETHGKPAPTNLKKEKKMSIATIPLLQLRECLFSDLPSDDPFFLLHRRIEWFFHWFIESASPIHIDCQWRVFLPYVVFKKDTLRSIKAHASSQKDSKKSDRHDNDHIIHPGLLRKTREVCEEKSREFFLSELERRKRKKEDIERDGRGNEVKGEPMKEGKGERDHDDSSFLKRLKDDKDGKETDDKYSVLPVFAVYRHQHDSAQQRSSLHDPQHHSETFFSSENKREKRDGRRAGDKEDEKPLAQAEEEKEQEHNNGRTTRGDEEKPFEVSAEEEEEGKGVNDENLDPSLSKNEECQNNTHHSPSRSTAVLPSSKVSGGSPSVKKEKSLRRKRKTDNDDEEGREPPLELAYHLAGVCTVYTFYALTGFRRRISQFMIFPHMQRQGR
ncbi:histone lysine acetyltransferase hat1 [Cystoisospora suis]|uniref:histone acetyltransferase n=1 Tax=Cystoisospora suis TaxID=483139 RepID=A0A2C6JET4_9APIC|nr:histone lysine acetyltransferase hat1 [Cystoisospora suis]